ncbi:alpha/beta fold hydrolase [Diaphorobacter caeni]|uniref:alpha/beta fold hydrolase n=1 Tax=Diaphorobacter caeni TaxID=2784387 RepID=UPI00188ED3B8|nr:alpha/beta hydrolase [Diaphorobacter caeni]MBF5003892.1 alpha/beta hydrolase [Diaphorobacter caeni]
MGNHPLVAGHGPRHVLVVHGWFGSAQSWRSFIPEIDPEQFTYAFIDCRGYGARQHEDGPYDMQTVAGDVLAVADQLGWKEFDLIGHSMGGKAIQHALRLAPGRVRRLVAITPVPAVGVPFDDETWTLFSNAAGDADARTAIVSHSTGGRMSASLVQHIVAHSLEQSRTDAFAAYLPSWARTDLSDGLQGLPHPMLVVVGAHDPGLTVQAMQATFSTLYPQARIEVLADAGHYPMDETPRELVTLVERFLSA